MMMSLQNYWALSLLAALPPAGALVLFAWRRQRQALAVLGDPLTLQGQARVCWGARRWKAILFLSGIGLLIVGIAGPRWGRDPGAELALAGRDVVVVLDLSRSMLAEQPRRQERARRALADLADALQRHGGHRLALVIFAARPRLMFPLTGDYDHFRAILDKLDADNLPADMRPDADNGPTSGTRIGAALALAVEAHDPRFAGAQDILLLSDGDDPGDDAEWARGINAARQHKIPVHVVGVGDPENASPIPFRDGVLRHADKAVLSHLQEAPLKDIAARTEGEYIPARNQPLPLGRWFRDIIAARQHRPASEVDSTAHLRLLRPRHAWFLAAALALLTAALLIPEKKGTRFFVPSKRPAQAVIAGLFVLLLAAAVPEVDDLVREGNAAFDRNDFDAALTLYEQAEERSTDPGLVAFNKGTALYRLGRFREAELHYRRCLQDALAPSARQARAWYDLGNCMMKQAAVDNRKDLEGALACYRECLQLSSQDVNLRADAEYNFEIARLLWLEARPKPPTPPEKPDPSEPKNGAAKEVPAKKGDKVTEKNGDQPESSKERNKLAAPGKLLVLPDNDRLLPLSPEDTMSFLERTRARVLQDRREYRRLASTPSEKVKDW